MKSILYVINRIDNGLSQVIKPIVIILSLFVASALVFGIVSRSALNNPLLGLEELILFAIMWLYMLGASLASREGSHLSADFINNYVKSDKLKQFIRNLAMLISLIAVLAFVVWSYSLLTWGFTMQQSTPVFQLPMFITQSSMFVASILFLFYMIRDILTSITGDS